MAPVNTNSSNLKLEKNESNAQVEMESENLDKECEKEGEKKVKVKSEVKDETWPQMTRKTWPINDDIVISGIAGRFPESDNIDELAENLFANIDMVTCDDRRWPIGLNDNQASRSGKLKSLSSFDSTYFCMLPIIADQMEPGSRIILETTYEAIADAGLAPQSIRGTRTGVYCGINTVACAEAIPQDDFADIRAKDSAIWVYGSSKALLANRISFLFDLIGPSTVIDTACSAALVALCNATQDMRMGVCDTAIVCTANLCLAPYSSHIFASLGLLAPDGRCKVFDERADGFVRSETVGTLLLQRRSAAKRIYATVLHAKTNTDGFKTIGLFAPYWLRQRNLMIETYQEAGVDPNEVKYFESHGTGTNVGDPQEAKAISEAYCGDDRPDRLLIGAVKSNLGHTEGASGLCSIAKAIITFEREMIPANLHYCKPKLEIDCLHRTIEPVVRNVEFKHDVIGVNSFGVGGVNAHALLQRRENDSMSTGDNRTSPIPRLVTVCGRTEAAIEHIFDFIQTANRERASDDFFALLNDAMKTTPIKGSGNFPFRGYMLIDYADENETATTAEAAVTIEANESDKIETKKVKTTKYERTIEDNKLSQPIYLIFTGMGSQWTGMGRPLMSFDAFRRSIDRSAKTLKSVDVDLHRLIETSDDTIWSESVAYRFVAITAMQIALYDLLRELQLPIDGFVGHSFGEIACAYADSCLTAEQAILCSYWRGRSVQDADLEPGLMAAVGLSWEDAGDYCDPSNGVYLACHNGHDSVTISGRREPMLGVIERLQADNRFVRPVAGGEFAYHSPEMGKVAADLHRRLIEIIPQPIKRSDKWISTSVLDQDQEDPHESQFASSAYFVNNLRNAVRFDGAMRRLPAKAICVEMAPHALFESIFKRCHSTFHYVALMNRKEAITDDDDGGANLRYFLRAIGHLYTFGYNPATEHLYPPIRWPVKRGTQSIGALLRWDHSRPHFVKRFPAYHNFSTASDYTLDVMLIDSDWRFLRDHCIDGRVVFPATGYLAIVWRAMATRFGQPWRKVPIQFENVRIWRPTLLGENTIAKFSVQIIEKTGDFVLNESGNLICTGKVSIPDGANQFLEYQADIVDDENDPNSWSNNHNEGDDIVSLSQDEIYKELRIRGYDYGESFRGLILAADDGHRGTVQWTGNWISFIDSALHLALISLPIRTLFVPIGIELFRCDPRPLFDAIERYGSKAETKNSGSDFVDTQGNFEDNNFDQVKSKKRNSAKEINLESTTITHEQKLKNEYYYFREIAQKQNQAAQIDTGAIVDDVTATAISAAGKNSTETTKAIAAKNKLPLEMINFAFESKNNNNNNQAKIGDNRSGTILSDSKSKSNCDNNIGDDDEDEIETRSHTDDRDRDDDRAARFAIRFDFATKTLVTRGVEIRGMLPINVPRSAMQQQQLQLTTKSLDSGLMLEEYRFVPWFDNRAEEKEEVKEEKSKILSSSRSEGESLEQREFCDYVHTCTQLFAKIYNNFEPNITIAAHDNSDDTFLNRVRNCYDKKIVDNNNFRNFCQYEALFCSILFRENDDDATADDDDAKNNSPKSISELRSIIEKAIPRLERDQLNLASILATERAESFARPIFELIADNISPPAATNYGSRIKMLEICATSGANRSSAMITPRIVSLLLRNAIHKFELHCTVAIGDTRRSKLNPKPETDSNLDPNFIEQAEADDEDDEDDDQAKFLQSIISDNLCSYETIDWPRLYDFGFLSSSSSSSLSSNQDALNEPIPNGSSSSSSSSSPSSSSSSFAKSSLDLVIIRLNSAMQSLWNEDADNMQRLIDVIKPGGFIVTFVRYRLTPFEREIDRLLEGELSARLTVSEASDRLRRELFAKKFLLIAQRRHHVPGIEITLYRKDIFPMIARSSDSIVDHIHSILIDEDGDDANCENGDDSSNRFDWVEKLKNTIKTIFEEDNGREKDAVEDEKDDVEQQHHREEEDQNLAESRRLWIVSRRPQSGLLGFARSLRLEPRSFGDRIRFLWLDCGEKCFPKICGNSNQNRGIFDFTDPFVRELIRKDLVINVCRTRSESGIEYEDNDNNLMICGSYHFAHIRSDRRSIETAHAYIAQMQRGDLSSFRWQLSEHSIWNDGVARIAIDHVDDQHLLLPDNTTTATATDIKNNNNGEVDGNLHSTSSLLLCDVYYSAINFKDVVIASGKLIPGPESCLVDSVFGLEFAGRRRDTNERVMGIVPFKGIATTVLTGDRFVWPVPSGGTDGPPGPKRARRWTLAEAATIPIAYATAYYALCVRGALRRGESVLIHSAAGGVGQAALRICAAHNCRIFATVGTAAKREFLRTQHSIPDDRIFSSRDIAFEREIKRATAGKGVDVVLNALTGDKLQASIRCVAPNGRFLEIGKYDMQQNSSIGMFAFLNNITFHGVGLDCFFREGLDSPALRTFIDEVDRLLRDGIADGTVQPINYRIFERDQVEQAFRHMTTGEHIGKIIIRIRDEETRIDGGESKNGDCSPIIDDNHRCVKPANSIVATRRTWFHPHKVYVIAGGLGGLGLEFVHWMTRCGARKLVLITRGGARDNFQRAALRRFGAIAKYCNSFRVVIEVAAHDISDMDQCARALCRARALGPIGGIFNMAAVLDDALFANQTADAFRNVCAPKMIGLRNLDRLCRRGFGSDFESLEPLDYFVAISSYASGRGNVGQTNYAYANSAMERLIERRVADGLPGIAIQFGPIADVGIVAEHIAASKAANGSETPLAIMRAMGIEAQRISSCLDTLDTILSLRCGIFSSYVKLPRNDGRNRGNDSSGANDNRNNDEVIRQLCVHLNIDKRPEDECLGDIGLDSMAAVEIQQRLERDFAITLTLAEVRKITVKELKNFRDGNRGNLRRYSDDLKRAKANLSRIRFAMPTIDSVRLNGSAKNSIFDHARPLYCLPPLTGLFDHIATLVRDYDRRPIVGCHWTRQLSTEIGIGQGDNENLAAGKSKSKCNSSSEADNAMKSIARYYYDLLRRLEAKNYANDEHQQQISDDHNDDDDDGSEDDDEDDDDDDDDDENEDDQNRKSKTIDILCTTFGAMIIAQMCACKRISRHLRIGKLIVIDLLPISFDTMRDETRIGDYAVELMFAAIRLYIPERICAQSAREILELRCEHERVRRTVDLMRRCIGSDGTSSSDAPNDMSEIVAGTYARARIVLRRHFALRRAAASSASSQHSIRSLIANAMRRHKRISLEYIRFTAAESASIVGAGKSKTNLDRKKRYPFSMFDIDQLEREFADRYRLHVIEHDDDANDLMTRLDTKEFKERLRTILSPPNHCAENV